MWSNPLPPLWEVYKTTEDSFKIAKRAIKTGNPKDRQRLLQRTAIFLQPIVLAEQLIEKSQKETEELLVLALWVAFISFPRASVGMPSGRASVPFPQRWRVAHRIPTLARGNEKNEKKKLNITNYVSLNSF